MCATMMPVRSSPLAGAPAALVLTSASANGPFGMQCQTALDPEVYALLGQVTISRATIGAENVDVSFL